MKVLSLPEPSCLEVNEMDIPEPKADEVLIRVKYVGFCGSDLSSYRGNNPLVSYPRIPGHEVSGDVFKKGAAVPDSIKIGQKTTVIPYSNCGNCASCRRYRFNACQFNQTLGVQRDGAMAEFISIPWQKLIVDDDLSYLELVLVEPLTVGFHAAERGRVIDSDRVLVIGCGLIGIGAILASVERGAEVIVIDFDDNKLNLAKSLGASVVINASRVNVDEYLKEHFAEKIDVIVEAAGSAPAFSMALNQIAFTGRIVCIGYTKQEICWESKLLIQKEIDILGSRNATPADFKRVISFMKKNRLPVESLITHRTDFETAKTAVETWHRNANDIIKMVLEIN